MLQTKIIKTGNFVIKILIIILSFGFIAYRLFYKHDVSELANSFTFLTSHKNSLILLLIVIILMLLNWGLESLKWQYLIKKIEKVPFISSFMTVWAGLTVGSFTPNRTGEFFSRSFILEKANRWEGIFITFIGSISQLLPTMILGTLSGFFLVSLIPNSPYHDKLVLLQVLLGVSVVFTLLLILLYFRLKWLKVFFQKLIPKKYAEFNVHLDVYSVFSIKELCIALFLSTVRYVVFSIQFYLLMRLCNLNIPFADGLILVSAIFLVITAIPTFALTEFGVRGSVSIVLLEAYFMSRHNAIDISAGALLSSFLIWFINLIIPALIGAFFVFKLKFFRK